MKHLPMCCATYSPGNAGLRFSIISATPSTASVLRTSNPAWLNTRRLSPFGWQFAATRQGGATQSWTTAAVAQRREHASMKRSVPSPENVVTEVAKALEQIS
jgi:hypothetical protein